jgi:hypothetical protein
MHDCSRKIMHCCRKLTINYETAIKRGKFVVIAHGTTEEVERAKNILHSAGHTGVEVYAGGEKAANA